MLKKFFSAVFIAAFMMSFFPQSQALAAVSNWHKGVTIMPTWNGDFATSSFQQSVNNAASTGANYITLVVQQYQSNLYSTDIQAGGNTATDASLTSAINYIHSKGMQVMIKIHLDSYTGEWRAFINPSDRAGWFANYTNMLLHYAKLAQSNGVEALCIGSELIDMSTYTSNGGNTQNWITMINAVRGVYSGTLTYSANWGPSGFTDEKNNIGFWSALDDIGISAYFNLNTDNQVQNMVNAWSGYASSDIGPLSQRWGKPVLFTEVGYKSVPNAQQQPWNFNMGGGPDMTTQQNAYEALFEFWNNQGYMQGVDFWDWKSDPNAGGTGNTDYTPQNKPAQQTMAKWFGGGGGSGLPPPGNVSCAGPASNTFAACYFSDQNLTTPVLSRTDNSINFDWGTGSPDPLVPSDHFSARWQGNFNFSAGSYTFTAVTDDGMRVFVDGNAVIDQWHDQPATIYTATVNISGGNHLVKVEYYEDAGNAVAKVNWSQSGGSTSPPPAGSLSASASNKTVNAGAATQLPVTVQNNDGNLQNAVVDVEVYNSSGSQAFQQFYQGVNIPSGSSQTFTPTWTPSSSGTYTIKAGIFSSGWSQVLYWNNQVAQITVGSSSTQPPPPPPGGGSTIVYVNGYPTINGNYIDCNGNIDNDPAHHTTNPSDTDPAHHIGQNCPSGSFVATH